MFFRNENGIALIWVLILLVVVGTLAAALLTSARTHTDIAVHEERMSKAFHSAEAGVEYVKANIYEALEKINNNSDGDIIYEDEKFGDDIKFDIKINEAASNTLISEGIYDDYRQRIQFDLLLGGGLQNINIGEDDNKSFEEHFQYSGNNDFEDLTNVINWAQEFDWFNEGDSFEDFWKHYVDSEAITQEVTGNHEINGSVENVNMYIKGNLDIDYTGQSSGIIKDSIIVVEGNVSMNVSASGDAKIKDTVFIVKDYVDFGGASAGDDWKNPLFMIYGEEDDSNNPNQEGVYINIGGTGSFDMIIDDLSEDFNLPVSVGNWRQQ